uniref:UNC5C-like protein-like n=1 Tax=Saccoglossus kowalevskii TaxID=10224 RepID=A0ABM0MHN5_SACKO
MAELLERIIAHAQESGDLGGRMHQPPRPGDITELCTAMGDMRICPYLIDGSEVRSFPEFKPSFTRRYVAGMFDYSGGCLVLPQTRVKLYIPPGAIRKGNIQPIFLLVTDEKEYQPPLQPNEIAVTPTIFCGPHGLQFDKHVYLMMPCQEKIVDEVEVSVLFTPTEIDKKPLWDKDQDALRIIDQDTITLIIDHFSGSVIKSLISWFEEKLGIKKYIQLYPFLQTCESDMKLRIYGTIGDMGWICEEGEKKKYGGKLLAPRKPLKINDPATPVNVKCKTFQGWVILNDRSTEKVKELDCETIEHNTNDYVEFVCETSQPIANRNFKCDVTVQEEGNKPIEFNFSKAEQFAKEESLTKSREFDCEADICNVLDTGDRWKQLCVKIEGCTGSPTKHILNTWKLMENAYDKWKSLLALHKKIDKELAEKFERELR